MLSYGKLNKVRNWAMLLIFMGVGVMYFGFVWPSLVFVFFGLGVILMMCSVAIYFWVGVLSLRLIKVKCPKCNNFTKILGKNDHCMRCNAKLSFDPKYK